MFVSFAEHRATLTENPKEGSTIQSGDVFVMSSVYVVCPQPSNKASSPCMFQTFHSGPLKASVRPLLEKVLMAS